MQLSWRVSLILSRAGLWLADSVYGIGPEVK